MVCTGGVGSTSYVLLENNGSTEVSITASTGLLSDPNTACNGIQIEDVLQPIAPSSGGGSGYVEVSASFDAFTSQDCGLTISFAPDNDVPTIRDHLHTDLLTTTGDVVGTGSFTIPLPQTGCNYMVAQPQTIDFGNVVVGTLGSTSFTLEDVSTVDTEFLGYVLAPDNPAFIPGYDPSQELTIQSGGASIPESLSFTPSVLGPFAATSVGITDDDHIQIASLPVTGFGFGLTSFADIQAVVGAGPTPYGELDVQSAVDLTSLTIGNDVNGSNGSNGSNGAQITFDPTFQSDNCIPNDDGGPAYTPTVCNFNEGYTQINGDSPLQFDCTATSRSSFSTTLNFIDASPIPKFLVLPIECEGITPQFSITPSTIQTAGTEVCADGNFSQSITLTSTGGGKENVTGFLVTNSAGSSDFSFDWSAGPGVTLNSDHLTTSGVLTLTSAIAKTAGTYTDTLTWMVDPSPVNAVAIQYALTTTAVFDTTAHTLHFGPTAIGATSDPQDISVHLCGTHTGKITDIQFSDPNNTAFHNTSVSSASLPSGTYVGFSVSFAPKAGQSGTVTQVMTVTYQDDNSDISPIAVPVTLIGVVQGSSDAGVDAGVDAGTMPTPDAGAQADAATGNGATDSYYDGCSATNSSGGTGAVLLALISIVAIGSRRRRIDSQAS